LYESTSLLSGIRFPLRELVPLPAREGDFVAIDSHRNQR
jgi:hypothetical protein